MERSRIDKLDYCHELDHCHQIDHGHQIDHCHQARPCDALNAARPILRPPNPPSISARIDGAGDNRRREIGLRVSNGLGVSNAHAVRQHGAKRAGIVQGLEEGLPAEAKSAANERLRITSASRRFSLSLSWLKDGSTVP
jgi:hypothetical protein